MSICSEFIHNNRYKVFSDGTIISHTRNLPQILNPYKNKHGYLRSQFNIGGKKKPILIHRIIAETFLPNPENKPQVNHINGIKHDNRIENLEWATASENELHSYRTLGKRNGMKGKAGFIYSSSKRVCKIKNGIIIKYYDSVKLASRDNKINPSNIDSCLAKRRKTAGGYHWKQVEKNVNL